MIFVYDIRDVVLVGLLVVLGIGYVWLRIVVALDERKRRRR